MFYPISVALALLCHRNGQFVTKLKMPLIEEVMPKVVRMPLLADDFRQKQFQSRTRKVVRSYFVASNIASLNMISYCYGNMKTALQTKTFYLVLFYNDGVY